MVGIRSKTASGAGFSAVDRVAALRELARHDAAFARDVGWQMLLDLGRRDDRAALHELWLAGDVPSTPPGRTLGKNLGRQHSTAAARRTNLVNRIDDPWIGKTIGQHEGYNRLKLHSAPLVYALARKVPPRVEGRELALFGFDVETTTGAIEPTREVLALKYDPARHGNPAGGIVPLARIRDEIVELIDGLYVARVLYLEGGKYKHIGAFALRRIDDEDAR
jgi:hypothetical protein